MYRCVQRYQDTNVRKSPFWDMYHSQISPICAMQMHYACNTIRPREMLTTVGLLIHIQLFTGN